MHYHTNTYGPSELGFRAGFKKAEAVAANRPAHAMILLVHGLAMIREGVIADVFGKKTVTGFLKPPRILLAEDSVMVYLETELIKSECRRGVILAPFVSHKLLTKVMADPRATDIVYVPWAEEELAEYVTANPTSTQI